MVVDLSGIPREHSTGDLHRGRSATRLINFSGPPQDFGVPVHHKRETSMKTLAWQWNE